MAFRGGDQRCAMLLHSGGIGSYAGYSSYGRSYEERYGHTGPGGTFPYQAPSWGYVILYLLIIIIGLLGNFIFCFIIKKCDHLHRTHHFFYLAIAVMDMLACVLVVPFAIDSSSKFARWNLPEFLCKFYLFVDFAVKGIHAFLLVFGSLFLYFWYRKNESYATESGEIHTRRTKMHKWAIPLAWVLGVGVAIAPGAMATMNCGQCGVFHFGFMNSSSTEYYVNLSFLIVAFILPWIVLMFPLLALFMQLCGSRSPRLDFPHNRTAIIMVLFILLFIGSRAPHDIYELMKMFSSEFGIKGDYINRGLPYMSLETQMTMDCLVFIPILLHPLIFILFNGEYREGFRHMWRNLYCNKTGRSNREDQQNKYRNSSRPIVKPSQGGIMRGGFRKSGGDSLLSEVQPMIVSSQRQRPQPMVNQMQQKLGNPYIPQGQTYLPTNTGQPYIPMQTLSPAQQPLMPPAFDSSFDMESPADRDPTHQFPAHFTYGNFNYIDSGRVEPKIAYTPTNTPPKTPQIPRYDIKPFKQPNYVDGTWEYPLDQEPYTGRMPASQIPLGGYHDPSLPSSAVMVDVDDEQMMEKDVPMEIESLENSPGNTLKRKIEVTSMSESPGPRRRLESQGAGGSKLEDAPPRTNSKLQDTSKSFTNGQQSTVEITLSGRTRSREDLCPDRPRSRFEHAV